ncbi:hypothetical protein QGN32_15695 [Mycolicibacterium sp. ND9-15]|uniref:hypothetical protein n=1 Tax=Mycolicibacterium sp. ND9-15 TaxID=3042320 RepID=UPI002DD834D7|nr:hypothetical protein [Mycolicibacterium sp. ND9-15]WSE54922.1 hypothetical protein QGN32_15695 [Mycolicibacterium sp. ND9-15]
MGNILDPQDQTAFDAWRATGVTSLLQCVWVYDRPINIDGLQHFHHNLERGRLSRCIERSPLPFGRHRWISSEGSSANEIVAPLRPREQFDTWLEEQALRPLDVERGPGWHLAVLPFTDGGAGVSLVVSHCLTDGVGLCEALVDAAMGRGDPMSLPAAGSRRRWQALREDVRQAARDTPAIGRGVAAAARLARQSRGSAGAAVPRPTRAPSIPAGADETMTLPTVTISVDADQWDARAYELGGTSNTLLAGLATRLAQRLGRVNGDGSVALRLPVNERVEGDDRANAVSTISIAVSPAPVTTDLRELRTAIKRALIRHQQVADDEQAVLSLVPLLPLLPKRLVRAAGSAATFAVSSNLGVVDPAATRADGTYAGYFAMKILYPSPTRTMMHRLGGLQVFLSGRAQERVFVSATAYQPGRPNTNDDLRQELSGTLHDFSLTATDI